MITTVTLNVSVDKAYYIKGIVVPGTVARVQKCVNSAGGKGLNVSRIIDFCGEEVLATGFAGGFNGAVHRGNLFRSLISGCVIMFTTIWIASQAIPWTTALAKSVNLTNGASQVAALDQGGSPITYLYTQIVTQQNIKGLVIIGIIYVICMIFTVRGSKQRAAALKESEY